MNSTSYDRLVAILQDVHGVTPEDTTPETTYHDLGVDSLTVVELTLQLQRELGIALEDDELTDDLTLAETASLIDAKLAELSPSSS
ncbi:acyl carrier protein [Saccharopolyspora rosea]|uniref:Acyl carrier protein n=1 Tax=Saccharopolyspora rosea TaxID=524884 RepID=A0ABW3FNB1_9PSEU|nr:acyl carrier protein [Saccharopolyspora rosea]